MVVIVSTLDGVFTNLTATTFAHDHDTGRSDRLGDNQLFTQVEVHELHAHATASQRTNFAQIKDQQATFLRQASQLIFTVTNHLRRQDLGMLAQLHKGLTGTQACDQILEVTHKAHAFGAREKNHGFGLGDTEGDQLRTLFKFNEAIDRQTVTACTRQISHCDCVHTTRVADSH